MAVSQQKIFAEMNLYYCGKAKNNKLLIAADVHKNV
jgi:hypothetical protein